MLKYKKASYQKCKTVWDWRSNGDCVPWNQISEKTVGRFFVSYLVSLCTYSVTAQPKFVQLYQLFIHLSLSLLQFSRWGSDCAGFIIRSIHARRRVWMDGISLGSSLCFFYSMEVIRNCRKMYLDNISNFKTLSQIYYYRFLIWIYKLLLVGKKIILVMNSNKKPVTIC